MKQPMWPLSFQRLIQKSAAAHFFLPASSHVLRCRLDRVCLSVPGSFSLGLFAGSQLLWGCATQACVRLAALRPRIGRSSGQQPTAHSCRHCCIAQVCPFWHVLLMAVCWLKLPCGVFQRLILFQAVEMQMVFPTPALGLGVDVHKSVHLSEKLSQGSGSCLSLQFLQVKKPTEKI